ncbi:MAG TPA: DapH/DapD/GlmU-related protein [Polyangiaceae bacterium]|nr:DapH/DapD/GlmU-related protein [Polyangiaceae bacterium]
MTFSGSLQPNGGSIPPTHIRAASGGEEVDESMPHLGETNENPRDIGFFALLAEDLRTHEGDLFAQGFWALAVHRFGNWRMQVHPRVLRLPLSLAYRGSFKLVEWTCGISLRYTVVVGRRVRIWHHSGMILGALRIGDDVHIRQNTTCGVAHRGDPRGRKPIIGNRVDIGAGAVVVGGITIGDDSVIGANAVVLQDVPPNSVAVGIPARILPRHPLSADGSNHSA